MQNLLFSVQNVSVRGELFYPRIDIHARRLTFITGQSGCGKSTLLRLLNASLDFEQGKIFYRGKNIKETAPLELRREIILVPQKIWLFPASIKENFQEFYHLLEKKCPTDESMQNMLAKLGLEKRLDTACTELSGGERHRVYLAVCLSLQPAVLLLDEPTSALDHSNAEKLMCLLRELTAEQSIVSVCHDQNLFRFADERIHLEKQ